MCAIAYEIENNGPDASLTLVPLFNFREHSASSRPEDFHFRTSLIDNSLCLIPESHPDTAILFQTSEGIFSDHTPMFDIDMQLQTEVDLETDGLDCHYCPHEVTVFLPAKSHKQISVLCSVIAADETFTDITADTAFDILKERESIQNHSTKRQVSTMILQIAWFSPRISFSVTVLLPAIKPCLPGFHGLRIGAVTR